MTNPNLDSLAGDVKQISALVEGMKDDTKKITAELKSANEAIANKVSNAEAESAKAIKNAEALAKSVASQAEILTELQQKVAEGVKAGKAAPKTLGDIIIASEQLADFRNGRTSKARIEANTIVGVSGSPATSDNTIVAPDRLAGIIPGAFRSLKIEQAIPSGNTTSNAVEFTRELSFVNDAAETDEGDQKPESDLTFELVTLPVRTIAHFIKASKQVLDDSPALASYIDVRLRHGVENRRDRQIIRGTGNAGTLTGIMAAQNYTAFTPTSGEIALDGVNRAIEAVRNADYEPTAILMHTEDWHAIERLKVGGTASPNMYLVGEPLGVIGRVLWGLPVIVSNNMQHGRIVVADFQQAFQVWNRQGTVVEIFEQDGDNVQKNLLTIRAESRLLLAGYVPAAVRVGLLTNTSSS